MKIVILTLCISICFSACGDSAKNREELNPIIKDLNLEIIFIKSDLGESFYLQDPFSTRLWSLRNIQEGNSKRRVTGDFIIIKNKIDTLITELIEELELRKNMIPLIININEERYSFKRIKEKYIGNDDNSIHRLLLKKYLFSIGTKMATLQDSIKKLDKQLAHIYKYTTQLNCLLLDKDFNDTLTLSYTNYQSDTLFHQLSDPYYVSLTDKDLGELNDELQYVLQLATSADSLHKFSNLDETSLELLKAYPKKINSIEDFQNSKFYEKYACSFDESWLLENGLTNYAFNTSIEPAISIDFNVDKKNTFKHMGLTFYNRYNLSDKDLTFIDDLLSEFHLGNQQTSIFQFIKRNINTSIFRMSEAKSITVKGLKIRAGSVIQQTITIDNY